MKLFNIEVERSYWLLTIGVVIGIYIWFFFMAMSKFIEIKNSKIEQQSNEEQELLKEQFVITQRLKADIGIYDEVSPVFPEGFQQLYTPHFVVYSLNRPLLDEIVQYVEQIYSAVITDTNLYSFNLSERFPIYVYDDSKMYVECTKRPVWSGGFVMSRKIYAFDSKNLKNIIYHEVTHLIFNDFMAGKAEKISRWINEGLASYEENKIPDLRKPVFNKSKRLSADEFLTLDLSTASSEKVNIWYQQAESLIAYMLENYPGHNFIISY